MCPDLYHPNPCTNNTAGSTCEGWLIAKGTVLNQNTFSKILTRNSFPFTLTCQYNAGSLALFKLQQATPSTPYLWSLQSISGMNFLVCVSSRESCSFN